jgi:hypothetical protein
LYVDEYGSAGGTLKANTATGLGYDDGDLVASFTDTAPGFFNPFNPAALGGSNDGSDDAIFLFDPARFTAGGGITGVLFTVDWNNNNSADGIDLVLDPVGPAPRLLTDIDSNGNFDNDTVFTPPPTSWGAVGGPFPGTIADPWVETPSDFFVEEDGSAVLTQIPEPGTFVIWGLLTALAIGSGWIRRKR